MKNAIIIILGLLVVAGIGYGGYKINRWFNYTFGYEAQVEESIKRLVKPSCLTTHQQEEEKGDE